MRVGYPKKAIIRKRQSGWYACVRMMERPPQTPRMEREMSVEEAEDLMRKRINERLLEQETTKYASFALPVKPDGVPLLFERKQEPHKGLYSVIGGGIDESGLSAPSRSLSSFYFEEGGLESPTAALLRELDEELYGAALKRNDFPDQNIRFRILEQRLKPKRKAYVYDYPQNALNALYIIETDPELVMEPDPREIGNIKSLSELKPEEINPLSRFLLNLQGFTHKGLEHMTWGRVNHIALPTDILAATPALVKQGRANIELSYEPKTPSYVINY